jgi:hypothetical protein
MLFRLCSKWIDGADKSRGRDKLSLGLGHNLATGLIAEAKTIAQSNAYLAAKSPIRPFRILRFATRNRHRVSHRHCQGQLEARIESLRCAREYPHCPPNPYRRSRLTASSIAYERARTDFWRRGDSTSRGQYGGWNCLRGRNAVGHLKPQNSVANSVTSLHQSLSGSPLRAGGARRQWSRCARPRSRTMRRSRNPRRE